MAVTINGTTGITSAGGDSSAADNTINGVRVGRGAGSVSTNTAVGASALAANTTGNNNTAVGYQAGYSNTTGIQSVFVGYQAGYLVTGSYNHAFGYGAMSGGATTGTQNTAVARFVLSSLTSGSNNVGVGDTALQNTTTGSYNVAVGMQALLSNTTANDNTAVGYQAGYSTTTGIRNAFFGYQAGYSNTTGVGGVYIGDRAGYSNTTNSYSTCVGDTAGQNATGAFNTLIGGGAGYLITTGAKNTVLGGYTGNNGGLDIRTATGAIVLSDGDGIPRFYSSSSNADFVFNKAAGLNPAFALAVATTQKWIFWNNTGASDVLNIVDSDFSNGVSLSQNSNSWAGYSDARLKQNVSSIESGLGVVLSLEPVNYEWVKNSKPDVGFIAQQVKQAIPLAVIGNEEDFHVDEQGRTQGAMAVMHDKLIPYMVKAIQELKADLDATKAELAALKGTA